MSEIKKTNWLSLWFKKIDSEGKALKIIKWGSLIFLILSVITFVFHFVFFLYIILFYGSGSMDGQGSLIMFTILILLIPLTPVILSIILKKFKSRIVAIMFLLLSLAFVLETIINPKMLAMLVDFDSLLSFVLYLIIFFISIKVVEATFYYQKLKKSK